MLHVTIGTPHQKDFSFLKIICLNILDKTIKSESMLKNILFFLNGWVFALKSFRLFFKTRGTDKQ